jgi:hypothetical protein
MDYDTCACGREKSREALLCVKCRNTARASKRGIVERLWAEGYSTTQVREMAEMPCFQAGAYRAKGWDLPHRYRVTSATASCGEERA